MAARVLALTSARAAAPRSAAGSHEWRRPGHREEDGLAADGPQVRAEDLQPDGLRRQDQESAYIRNCAVYVFTSKTINSNKLWGETPYGYEMDNKFYSINIDEPIDVLTAQAFYNKMKKEKKLNLIEFTPIGEPPIALS